jgi:hypothetical protein
MKAQAMKSRIKTPERDSRQKDAPRDDRSDMSSDDGADACETQVDTNEDDLDESDLRDDDRWDVFILDDDGDPLPDYGDFWFPD